MNALKHGILSRQVLVRGYAYEEDETELESLHQRFWEELDPVGPVEEMLLDQIVTAHWRLRRALRAESGEIKLSVDAGQRLRDWGTDPMLQWLKWTALGDPIHPMSTSALGCSILVNWLGEVRADVEQEGLLTETAIESLEGRFGGKTNSLVSQLREFRKTMETALPRQDLPSPEQKRAEALAYLDRRIWEFQNSKDCHVDEDRREDEARQAAAVLPSAKVLDKILRYETKLERQLCRAMAQLERMQRLRNGEAIPAPMSVQVSERG